MFPPLPPPYALLGPRMARVEGRRALACARAWDDGRRTPRKWRTTASACHSRPRPFPSTTQRKPTHPTTMRRVLSLLALGCTLFLASAGRESPTTLELTIKTSNSATEDKDSWSVKGALVG